MKKYFYIFLSCCLIVSSLFLGCSEDSNPINSQNKFTIDNFPHEIGTVWKYQKISSGISYIVDTVYTRIAGETTISDDSIRVLIIVSESVGSQIFLNSQKNLSNSVIIPDTTYWHISEDTVTFYKYYFDSLTVTQKIVFPLKLGSQWTIGNPVVDTNYVDNISAKTILGRTYQNSYQIIRTFLNSIDMFPTYYSYVPNIGLIYSSSGNSIGYQTWSLISYDEPDSFELSEFPLQVGASWTYKVINNLADCINCYDSVTVTILDSNYEALSFNTENWLFDYPNQERVVQNKLRQFNELDLQWHHYAVTFSLKFPLTIGKKWTDPGSISSSMLVVGRETITTDAGTFENAYHLKGSTTEGFEPGANFEIWLAKGYGIVKLIHNGSPMGSYEDKSWFLWNYNPNNPFEPFTIDRFPNYEGTINTYEVYDNNSQTYDTGYISISDSSSVTLWNISRTDTSWQVIVLLEGTVAKFFTPDNMIAPYKTYQFPLEYNKFWITYPIGSVSQVLTIQPIITLAGRFFPTYQVQTLTDDSTSSAVNIENDWLSPDIGLVMWNISKPSEEIHESWRLINSQRILY